MIHCVAAVFEASRFDGGEFDFGSVSFQQDFLATADLADPELPEFFLPADAKTVCEHRCR